MAQEYNNEQVVKLFGKQMEKLGERKVEILKDAVEHKNQLQQHMDSFREKNKNIQQELDQTIESYEDRFTDTANVVEYDAARLEKKYLDGKTLQTSKSEIPCFTERASVASCYSQNKETTGCDSFIEALTECASKTITTK
jgi:predicted phage gp36 major capsid-like protein